MGKVGRVGKVLRIGRNGMKEAGNNIYEPG